MTILTYILTLGTILFLSNFFKQFYLPALLSSLKGGIVGKNSNPPKPIPTNTKHSFCKVLYKYILEKKAYLEN